MNIQKLKSIIKHEIVPYKNNKLILLPYFHKMTDAFEVENSIIDALIDNSKSIKQIAEMLGFANQSHFGTFFNRKAGMSPQQFRNSNR